eukprot:4025240-Pyramimonas_sp.AAC.1
MPQSLVSPRFLRAPAMARSRGRGFLYADPLVGWSALQPMADSLDRLLRVRPLHHVVRHRNSVLVDKLQKAAKAAI